VAERLGGIFFVVVGVLLLVNVGGLARLFADLGQPPAEALGPLGDRRDAADSGCGSTARSRVRARGGGIAVFPPS
jgi:hypothetical protein